MAVLHPLGLPLATLELLLVVLALGAGPAEGVDLRLDVHLGVEHLFSGVALVGITNKGLHQAEVPFSRGARVVDHLRWCRERNPAWPGGGRRGSPAPPPGPHLKQRKIIKSISSFTYKYYL